MSLSLAVLALIALSLANPAPLRAQADRGEIAGRVVDTARGPLADVDVFLRGAGRRARTDSAGMFRFTDVKRGSYALIARKIGYQYGEAEVKVRAGATARQDFELTRRVMLATVEVTAKGECPLGPIQGFFCRESRASGSFLDYPDIDYYGHTYTSELFRHLEGWRIAMRRYPDQGLMPVPVRSAGFCTMYLVDGRVVERWEDVPLYTKDLTAMEVYIRPDTVPPEIRREMAFHSAPGMGNNSRTCDAVVFWTRRAH